MSTDQMGALFEALFGDEPEADPSKGKDRHSRFLANFNDEGEASLVAANPDFERVNTMLSNLVRGLLRVGLAAATGQVEALEALSALVTDGEKLDAAIMVFAGLGTWVEDAE